MTRTYSTILITALTTLALTATAMGATSGSITLSGSISAATAITVTGQNNYNALDLTTNTTNLTVANVREINNTVNGYTVKLASANAGLLKNGSLGNVTYTGKYNGNAVTLSATPQTITTQGAQTGVINVVKPFSISYTGTLAENLMVGNYTDTLTFTITAN